MSARERQRRRQRQAERQQTRRQRVDAFRPTRLNPHALRWRRRRRHKRRWQHLAREGVAYLSDGRGGLKEKCVASSRQHRHPHKPPLHRLGDAGVLGQPRRHLAVGFVLLAGDVQDWRGRRLEPRPTRGLPTHALAFERRRAVARLSAVGAPEQHSLKGGVFLQPATPQGRTIPLPSQPLVKVRRGHRSQPRGEGNVAREPRLAQRAVVQPRATAQDDESGEARRRQACRQLERHAATHRVPDEQQPRRRRTQRL
mmetsp:Transcript_15123/g.43387  ORF Transcript_15123/g.43387 Transcript_15123/m.43387 type:complete len:255 (+) Transcript_15123:71-835(+)